MDVELRGFTKRIVFNENLIIMKMANTGQDIAVDIFTGNYFLNKLKPTEKEQLLYLIHQAKDFIRCKGYLYNSNLLIAEKFSLKEYDEEFQEMISKFKEMFNQFKKARLLQ